MTPENRAELLPDLKNCSRLPRSSDLDLPSTDSCLITEELEVDFRLASSARASGFDPIGTSCNQERLLAGSVAARDRTRAIVSTTKVDSITIVSFATDLEFQVFISDHSQSRSKRWGPITQFKPYSAASRMMLVK